MPLRLLGFGHEVFEEFVFRNNFEYRLHVDDAETLVIHRCAFPIRTAIPVRVVLLQLRYLFCELKIAMTLRRNGLRIRKRQVKSLVLK